MTLTLIGSIPKSASFPYNDFCILNLQTINHVFLRYRSDENPGGKDKEGGKQERKDRRTEVKKGRKSQFKEKRKSERNERMNEMNKCKRTTVSYGAHFFIKGAFVLVRESLNQSC